MTVRPGSQRGLRLLLKLYCEAQEGQNAGATGETFPPELREDFPPCRGRGHRLLLELQIHRLLGFPVGTSSNEHACHAGDAGSISGSGRPPGEGNGNPLQYFCLKNPMDRGAWVHGVTKSQTRPKRLSMHARTVLYPQSQGNSRKPKDFQNSFEGESWSELTWGHSLSFLSQLLWWTYRNNACAGVLGYEPLPQPPRDVTLQHIWNRLPSWSPKCLEFGNTSDPVNFKEGTVSLSVGTTAQKEDSPERSIPGCSPDLGTYPGVTFPVCALVNPANGKDTWWITTMARYASDTPG